MPTDKRASRVDHSLQCCPTHIRDPGHTLAHAIVVYTHTGMSADMVQGTPKAEQQAGLLPPPSVTHVQPQWG